MTAVTRKVTGGGESGSSSSTIWMTGTLNGARVGTVGCLRDRGALAAALRAAGGFFFAAAGGGFLREVGAAGGFAFAELARMVRAGLVTLTDLLRVEAAGLVVFSWEVLT